MANLPRFPGQKLNFIGTLETRSSHKLSARDDKYKFLILQFYWLHLWCTFIEILVHSGQMFVPLCTDISVMRLYSQQSISTYRSTKSDSLSSGC
jgi:hypothetical protein